MMSLAHIIQDAWNRQSSWLKLLRPLSYLYGWAFEVNKKRYLSGQKYRYVAPIPVFVIGNITVGGSGKTPLLIALVEYLQQHNIKVGVISRGYGGIGPFPVLVNHHSAKVVGDEPALIVQKTKVPMAVGANRQEAIELLLGHHELDLIISDDGLQHWALARQLEWIVLDTQRGLGNQKLLPEGFLREPIEKLKNNTVIEHNPQSTNHLNMHLQVGQPYCLYTTQKIWNPQQRFHVIVGIGYPQRFYQTLEHIGVIDIIKHEFSDHHDYQQKDVDLIDCPIITTEKDAIKLKDLTITQDVWVVPVEAVLSDDCYLELKKQLLPLGVLI